MKKVLIALCLSLVLVFAVSSFAMASDYANRDLGEMWEVDETLYTWKVNATLGGQTNLPAVNLGATGGNASITNVNDQLIAALTSTTFVKPNNLICAFTDGGGFPEITFTEYVSGNLIVNEMPYQGSHRTNSLNPTTLKANVTTDSAAGGTALATGYKTAYGYMAIDVKKNEIPTLAEVLREKFGKIIGIVTTDWSYDATPAAFGGAHCERNDSAKGKQMGTFAPDLWIGVGTNDYSPTQYVSAEDDVYLAKNWAEAEANYNHNKLWVDLPQITDTTGFSAENMNQSCCIYNYFDYATIKSSGNATISMMTAFSLTWLQAKSEANNNVGFFMMFENTGTDMAGHAQEVEWGVIEYRATDEMVAICLKFACENPDTLVVFTADHETGGMKLKNGWESDLSKVKYTSSSHSNQDVPVFALGYEEYAKLFANEKLFNCQVGKLMAYVMGVEDFGMPADEWPEYDIAPVIAGEWGKTEATEEKVTYIEGKVLGIAAKAETSEIKFTLNNMNTGAHAMLTLAVKVPAGATNIVITDENGNVLREQALDGASNYFADQGCYFFSLKAVADLTKVTVKVTGTFAKADEVLVDYVTVGANINTMDNYDVTTVETDAYASVHDVAETVEIPAEDKTDDKAELPEFVIPLAVGAVAIIAIVVVMVVVLKKK